MLPHFNPHLQNPNNQLQLNGANALAPPQQVMGNQGNLGQIGQQFQAGMLSNPQMPMPPFTNPNPFFAPNQMLPLPQGGFQNPNPGSWPQPFVQNAVNPPQFLPNGPLNVPNLVQTVTQLLQLQMMNAGPQNLGLFMNLQAGGVLPQPVNGNGFNDMNHNGAATKDAGFHQAQQNWDVFSPGASNPQINSGVVNDVNGGNNNRGNSQNKNFNVNHRHDGSQRGSGNRQFHHRQNTHGKFKFNNENRGKGNGNFGGKIFNLSNPSDKIQEGKKRPLILNYTEKEIQQWREERKKNYPSKANTEKKFKRNPEQSEVTDDVSKIRRQQLKEILAKQAELGCEVAEIPSCYLSDTEQRTDHTHQNNKMFGKRGRFQNKFDKKGKFQQRDRFPKRQRYENSRSPGLAKGHTKEPSLLKKLLNPEIKKDKKHLLQVFRFMVANKFFESWPEKPLKFPPVIVKESSGGGNETVKLNSEVIDGDASDGLGALEDDKVDAEEKVLGERPQ